MSIHITAIPQRIAGFDFVLSDVRANVSCPFPYGCNMVAIAPVIMSAVKAENDKKPKSHASNFCLFIRKAQNFLELFSTVFSCDSLARRGSQGHPRCKEVGKNEGQDCWDWLITWGPHITLPQIKVELC